MNYNVPDYENNSEKWLPPRTSRVYLHAPFASRIIMLFPDFKICDLELSYRSHTDQSGFAITILDGAPGNERQLNFAKTEFDPVTGFSPVYTVRNTLGNGCEISLTALADTENNPAFYGKVIIYNGTGKLVNGSLTVFPRTTDRDHYITNLRDTGYDPYIPNVKTQYMLPSSWEYISPGTASDGYGYAAVYPQKMQVSWVDRVSQPLHFHASDCLRLDYSLEPGESAGFVIAGRYGENTSFAMFEEARSDVESFWADIQGKVKKRPVCDDRTTVMYRQMIIQSLQMLATYSDMDGVIPRQGDVGRFCWSWEAVHYLEALDRIGLSDYTSDAYRTLAVRWQNKDPASADFGRMMSPDVYWDNSTGKTLEGVSLHLVATADRNLFVEMRPFLLRGFEWIERKRSESYKYENAVRGLFPPGRASDWGEIGQHWTFTDAVNVAGYRALRDCFLFFGDEEAAKISERYTDYLQTVKSVLENERRGHENDEAFVPSHITNHSFEELRRHCYYTDGAPYLYLCGIIDATDPVIDQMERYYRLHGLINHGLMGRLTNNDDMTNYDYGDVYYTGVAEANWIYPWLHSGRKEKAMTAFNALLRYGMTKECITSERYCSRDEWYTPWSPNGSACGRMINLLLDIFGESETGAAKS